MNIQMICRVLAALCCAVVTASHAQSQLPLATAFKIVEEVQHWQIISIDESWVERRAEMEALSSEGAQGLTSVPLAYQEGWQQLEVLDAYTLKPDGRKLQVDRASIQTQKGLLGGAQGVSWPEYRALQLKFPDVQVGDHTVLSYRTKQGRAFLPGWQNFAWIGPQTFTTERLTIELRAPKNLPIAISAKGMERGESTDGDQHVWTFGGRFDARPADNNPLNLTTTMPHVYASTYASPEAVGSAFATGFQSRLKVTDKVRKVADEASEGAKTPDEVARRLYDWIRKNIRYNAVFIGAGGWVPNEADTILASRFGDCKDHVLLLSALLEAKGIDAVPALINGANEYQFDRVNGAFDHVIAYIPSLKLYLDPTAALVPAGELPFAIYGKPVVLAHTKASTIAHTPAIAPGTSEVDLDSDYLVNADGGLTGTLQVRARGDLAHRLQQWLSRIAPGQQESEVRRLLATANRRGSGHLRFDPVDRDSDVQTLKIEFHIDDYLASPEAGAVSPQPNFPGLHFYIGDVIGNYNPQVRRTPFRCSPVTVRERFKLRFDPKFTLHRIPDSYQKSVDQLAFSASYSVKDHVLQGERSFVQSTDSMVCDPGRYQVRREAAIDIRKHLRQQVSYNQ